MSELEDNHSPSGKSQESRFRQLEGSNTKPGGSAEV